MKKRTPRQVLFGRVMIDATKDFKVGDPCPHGYVARQEWAEVHYNAGLRQKECCACMRWKFPHELSEKVLESFAYRDSALTQPFQIISRICLECESKRASQEVES